MSLTGWNFRVLSVGGMGMNRSTGVRPTSVSLPFSDARRLMIVVEWYWPRSG